MKNALFIHRHRLTFHLQLFKIDVHLCFNSDYILNHVDVWQSHAFVGISVETI